MSVINTNVTSLIAQNALAANNSALNTSLERLSTGLKINSGADDPAGLIASQSLAAQQTGLQAAISNASRATNVIGTAEGGLNEVSSLLTQLDGLVNSSANSGGLSSGELAANQLQVDSILSTINRLAGSTTFNGKQLLNGNLDYTTSSAAASAITGLAVNSATLQNNQTQTVVVNVLNSATAGKVAFSDTATASSATTLQIAGVNGSEQLSFGSGTTIAQIATAVNGIATSTGVTASAVGATLTFLAQNDGSQNYVSVQSLTGTFAVTGGTSGKASGKDAVVQVNGALAQANGTAISYSSSTLDLNFTLTAALNAGKSKTFGITGGGATFALVRYGERRHQRQHRNRVGLHRKPRRLDHRISQYPRQRWNQLPQQRQSRQRPDDRHRGDQPGVDAPRPTRCVPGLHDRFDGQQPQRGVRKRLVGRQRDRRHRLRL